VSIRMLRYYDQVGLLKPKTRSNSGYRLYGRDELLRLREILVWRQLGFPIADIAALMDDPTRDRAEAVRRQLAIARAQAERLSVISRGLELAVSAIDAGRPLGEEEVFAAFSSSLSEGESDGRPPGVSEAHPMRTDPGLRHLSTIRNVLESLALNAA